MKNNDSLSQKMWQKALNLSKIKKECLHTKCPECHGSGRKKNGETCVHFISCPCERCNLTSLT